MPQGTRSRRKVLRIAVIVDGIASDELHQTAPESVTAGSALDNRLMLFGRRVPLRHTLFEYRDGSYFLDLPAHTKGGVQMRGRKTSVKKLRRNAAQGETLRLPLDSTARGKLRFGETTLLFRFTKPAPIVPKPPFPVEFKPTVRTMYTRLDLSTMLAALLLFGPYFTWVANQERDPDYQPEVDDRFKIVMGVYEPEEEEEPEEESEEEVLAQEDEEEEKEEEEDKPEETKELKERPKELSEKAVAKARGMALARALGTYGGEGEGSVFDVIQSTENNLGEVFENGMGIGNADGGDFGALTPGAEGMGRSGEVVDTKGFDVTDGGPEVAKIKKRETKVKAKDTEIHGDHDKRAIKGVIRRKMSALQNCYNKALRTRPDLAGKISYSITISPMGTVTGVRIEDDSVGDNSVADCTKKKISGWRFPSDGAEEASEVNFSVVFSGSQ